MEAVSLQNQEIVNTPTPHQNQYMKGVETNCSNGIMDTFHD